MATPKSTIERIKRKVRLDKPDTPHDDHDMTGRVVAKKTGNNDPRRNKPKLTSEAFLNFYLDKGKPENVEQTMVVLEKLIKYAMHFEGKLPFKISRLMEMRESLKEAIFEEVNKEYSMTFKVTSQYKDNITGIWEVLNMIQYLGKVGASRNIVVSADGDGSCRVSLDVVKNEGDLSIPEIDEKVLDSGDGINISIGE